MKLEETCNELWNKRIRVVSSQCEQTFIGGRAVTVQVVFEVDADDLAEITARRIESEVKL